MRGPTPLAQADDAVNAPAVAGVIGCADCHSEPSKLRVQQGVTKYVSLNEYTHWDKRDKHAGAVRNFFQHYQESVDAGETPQLTPRVAEMTRLLGWGDLTKDQRCLSCHANWQQNQPKLDDFNLSLGVNCESCHGPSERWIAPHQKSDWRVLPAAEKEKLGMINVRSPIQRAEQCVSCHVGNVAEGKVLTHEMYVAGHPPLPGIEVETFAEHMPPHWRYPEEKTELPNREKIFAAAGLRPDEKHRTKSVLVGAAVTLSAAVNLLGRIDAAGVADFAQFDCASCHHELRDPSWRQRRIGTRPGRPQLPVWATALLELAIHHSTADDPAERKRLRGEFRSKLTALEAAYAASPLGDSPAVATARDQLVSWLDALALRLEEPKQPIYGPAACQKLLEDLWALTQQGPDGERRGQALDYESARQLAWALLTIYKDVHLEPKDPSQESVQTKELRAF